MTFHWSQTEPFPLLKGELWKYSQLEKWHGRRFYKAPKIDQHTPEWTGKKISCFNGRFMENAADLQFPSGIFFPFAINNRTGSMDLIMDQNPTLLFFLSSGVNVITVPYIQILVPSGTQAVLIEVHQHADFSDSLSLPMQHIIVEKGASLKHGRIISGRHGGSIVQSTVHVNGSYSLLQWFCHDMHQEYIGNIFLETDGARAICQHVILALKTYIGCYQGVYHRKPHTMSRNLCRGVVSDTSASFRAFLEMSEGVYQTDGAQKGEAILFNERAAMYGKPELKIYADDVICTHGMAISSLPEDQLFYCKSRGIPERLAEHLIIRGFVYSFLNASYSSDHFFYQACDSSFKKQFG